MPLHSMANDLANLLATHPELAFDFYCAASEIVDDFEDWGPVLQANENGEYDDSTTIVRLRTLRSQIIALSREPRP